jgi:hypothetical protein
MMSIGYDEMVSHRLFSRLRKETIQLISASRRAEYDEDEGDLLDKSIIDNISAETLISSPLEAVQGPTRTLTLS